MNVKSLKFADIIYPNEKSNSFLEYTEENNRNYILYYALYAL